MFANKLTLNTTGRTMIPKLRLLTAALTSLFMLFAVSFGAEYLFGQEPSTDGAPATNVQNPPSFETDPVPACEKMISENALYADALNILRPWVLDPGTVSSSLRRAIELSCVAMGQIGETADIDSFLEGAVQAHPEDWRVLAAAAQQYSTATPKGALVNGQFRRGLGLGINLQVDSSERDRVRALQLYVRGMDLLEKERAAQNVTPGEVYDFYCEFARTCLDANDRWARLQKLTDLETLPDYRQDTGYSFWNAPSYPPVDDEGNPIFYDVPESFAAAQNDGQRWRFLLNQAAASGAPDASGARFLYADFLMEEFGPGSLGVPRQISPEDERDGGTALAALGSLASLDDDETITRLADGIRRFRFPEGHNPLSIYRDLMEDPSVGIDAQIRAATELGRAYLNRTQYLKAEEVYRNLLDLEIKAELPEYERVAREELDILTGNYGAFAPTTTKTAGENVSFLWKYRNGKKARFRAQEINVRLFLQDAIAYLRESEKDPPEEWLIDKLRIENIGWKLLNDNSSNNKYLSSDVADWSVELDPAADHHDCSISLDFPITKPGAYLLRGKMENGNSDAIVIWISNTAILKKQVEGKTFWYVGDAKTGAPIPEAHLRFFGYSINRMPFYRGAKPQDHGTEESPDARPVQNRWQIRTVEFHKQTNVNGWLFTDANEMPPRFRWLAEASVPTEDGGGRFAYYGFEDIWYDHDSITPFHREGACFLSDRPIYRPKDTVRFRFQAGTSRYDQPDEWTWKETPARLVITGPDGKEIVSKEVTLDETGGLEDSLETDESFHLGVYSFRLDVPYLASRQGTPSSSPKWRSLGHGTVTLEEYRKPEFEVTVDTPEKPIALGEKITVRAHADYYFGSPVTNARVSWRVMRSRAAAAWYPICRWDWLYGNGYAWLAPSAPWYPGWSKWGTLPPPMPWHAVYRENSEVVASGKTDIGEDGAVEIPIDTAPAAQLYPGVDQSYEVIVEVTDDSRRQASGSGKILVSEKPFRVTTWSDRGFHEPRQQIDCHVAARRVDGEAVAGVGLVTVSRVRLAGENTKTGVKNVEETPVLSEEIAVAPNGEGNISFTLPQPGLYHFRCVVDDGEGHRVEGGSLLTITGPAGENSKDAGGSNPLDIIPEKPEYHPGEKARLRISSSSPDATVLLFVRGEENNGGTPHLVRLTGGSAVFEFEIADADMPNIWVEGVAITDGRVRHTARNIPVPPVSRVIDVKVTPDKQSYKPGEHSRVKVRLTDPDGNPVVGIAAAAVYDRSLDALSHRPVLDVRKFFWDWTRRCASNEQHNLERWSSPIDFPQKNTMQPLGTAATRFTNELLDGGAVEEDAVFGYAAPMRSRSLVALSGAVGNAASKIAPTFAPKEAVAADADFSEGSGMPSADEASLSEPEIRSEFADTAFWAGLLRTDENGEAELSFDMPENVTSWKMRVWSFAPGTRVGEGTAEVVTRKNLILRMERPRFLTQTDTVLLSAIVHNYTDSEQKGEVALEIDPDAQSSPAIRFHTGSEPIRQVTIPAAGQVRVDWQVDAVAAASVMVASAVGMVKVAVRPSSLRGMSVLPYFRLLSS